MRIVSIALMIFMSCATFYAQDEKESKTDFSALLKSGVNFDDDCGNPAVESQLYVNRKGKIVKIISANEVVFQQVSTESEKEKQKFTVELVGIDAGKYKNKSKEFLQKYVLNQEVEIIGNIPKNSSRKFGGLIWLSNDNETVNELNEYLLENGIAKYKPFESANLVPYYIPCRLQKAEERAKKEKLGIWAK